MALDGLNKRKKVKLCPSMTEINHFDALLIYCMIGIEKTTFLVKPRKLLLYIRLKYTEKNDESFDANDLRYYPV